MTESRLFSCMSCPLLTVDLISDLELQHAGATLLPVVALDIALHPLVAAGCTAGMPFDAVAQA